MIIYETEGTNAELIQVMLVMLKKHDHDGGWNSIHYMSFWPSQSPLGLIIRKRDCDQFRNLSNTNILVGNTFSYLQGLVQHN